MSQELFSKFINMLSQPCYYLWYELPYYMAYLAAKVELYFVLHRSFTSHILVHIHHILQSNAISQHHISWLQCEKFGKFVAYSKCTVLISSWKIKYNTVEGLQYFSYQVDVKPNDVDRVLYRVEVVMNQGAVSWSLVVVLLYEEAAA